ncbi:MAG: DUF4402 domain-containing protein [Bacteroidales bacterium]|jgi:hypothetical protein|nr:DUF4402 domain-containing protein [Bacteroidales bacterium]MDY0332616.1 DUF4402 domain-containing protein [Bacteroidales bacterium]
MKKLTITLIFGLLLTGFSVSLKAQETVTATASAELVEALTATEVTQLNFGRFLPGSAVGTISIAAVTAGTRTKGGDVFLVGGGNPASAEFLISGYSGSTVNVGLPTTAVELTHATNSAHKLEIASFTASETAPVLNTSGEATIYVGGVLNILASDAGLSKGLYSGTYPVTFQYP